MENLHCPACGYDQRGSPDGDCPECGGPIDRNAIHARLSDAGRIIRAALTFVVAAPFFFMLTFSALRSPKVWWAYFVVMLVTLSVFAVADLTEANFRRLVLTGTRPGLLMSFATVLLLFAALAFFAAIMTLMAAFMATAVFKWL